MRRDVGLTMTAVLGLVGAVAVGQRGGAVSMPATGKVPFTISKDTTAITGPLRADGTVDYVAALNERYGKGVTPENNGFVVWLRVVGTGDNVIFPKTRAEMLRLCGATETPAGAEVWEGYADYLARVKGLSGDALAQASTILANARQGMWTAADQPDLAAFLKLREKNLTLTLEAVERTNWWMPIVTPDGRSLMNMILPSLAPAREVCYALCARATLRAKLGDMNGFWVDVWTVKALARKVGAGPSLIERLVGVAMDAYADEAIGTVAASGILTEAQCRFMLDGVSKMPPLPTMAEAVDCGERWMMLDTVALVAAGHINLLEVPTGGTEATAPTMAKIFGTISREAVDWDAVLKLVNGPYESDLRALRNANLAEMRAGMRQVDQQLAAWRASAKAKNGGFDFSKDASETRVAYSAQVGQDILAVLLPSIWKAELLRRCAEQEQQMVEVLLAAAQVKAKTGSWPATREELVPGLLKESPKDMYSENGSAPFKYVIRNGGVRVYSVGENGKDDGGVMDRTNGKDDLGVGVK